MTQFTLRPAEMADVEAIVTFGNMWEKATAGTQSHTVEDLQAECQTPGFDMSRSTRLAVTDQAEIIGYVFVWAVADPPVNPYFQFAVHPQRYGEGISRALLAWAESHCRELLPCVPDTVRVTVDTDTISTDVERRHQLERAGFNVSRHFFHMEIKLDERPPAPQWPAGIKIHHYQTMKAVLTDLELILTAVREAFRDHFGHVERSMDQIIEKWTHRITTDTEFDPTLWYIAMDGDEVAGTILCRPRSWDDPDEGYVPTLAVRRPWRRRGLGLALLHHAFNEFYRRGKPKAGLGVDASSLTGAVALYERAGMHITRQYDVYEKEIRAGEDIRTQ